MEHTKREKQLIKKIVEITEEFGVGLLEEEIVITEDEFRFIGKNSDVEIMWDLENGTITTYEYPHPEPEIKEYTF